jgi:two-component system, NtrC family, response regulator GlrR
VRCEGVGIVEEVGAGVLDFTPGDYVLVSRIISCGRCAPCKQGEHAHCQQAGGRILRHLVDCPQTEFVKVPSVDIRLDTANGSAASDMPDTHPAVAEARPPWSRRILTRSAKMHKLIAQVGLVAQTEVSVLIWGESGTGKELLAQALHLASGRSHGPFTPVNCSAMPENLLESELFGHRKGAFTGATRDHPGLFVASRGGTVFLDEIGDMPLVLQAKLLRVLQERRVRPVGDTVDRPIDVRIVSATHCDLVAAVKDGNFREDLYYRLNGVELELPSLRERPEDIPLLAHHFLQASASRQGTEPTQLSPDAMFRLLNYHWPGNVRQLQNVIEQTVALSTGPVVSDADIARALPDDRATGLPTLSEAKQQCERDYMIRLLQLTGGSIAETARYADRDRSDLYKVIKRHGIDLDKYKA